MIKKYSVLVGLVFMLGIVGCQQTVQKRDWRIKVWKNS